jgi:hypothetical protein
MARFICDDIVIIRDSAPAVERRGEKAWVIAVLEDRVRFPLKQFPPGVVYAVEFEGGDAIDVHEDDVELESTNAEKLSRPANLASASFDTGAIESRRRYEPVAVRVAEVENPEKTTIVPGSGAVGIGGHAPEMQLFQFYGLLCATEYNAIAAGLERGMDAQTVNAMNTLLMGYAALQALVLETALIKYPDLYADRKGFRKAGIVEQYEKYLANDGRPGEPLHPVIEEISAHRIALTHSEPDNPRTFVLGNVISATDAARFAAQVRNVAEWLWRGERPGAVSASFDESNVFLRSGPPR